MDREEIIRPNFVIQSLLTLLKWQKSDSWWFLRVSTKKDLFPNVYICAVALVTFKIRVYFCYVSYFLDWRSFLCFQPHLSFNQPQQNPYCHHHKGTAWEEAIGLFIGKHVYQGRVDHNFVGNQSFFK